MKTDIIKFYPLNDLVVNIEHLKPKKIEVNFKDRKQLFDIVRKRHQYKYLQPTPKERRKIIRALEELDQERIHNA